MSQVLPYEPQTLRAAPPQAMRLDGVDGLRALAALIVLVFHMYGQSNGPELRLWHHINVFRPLHDGWAAVNLFLVLSGFCLYWPYAARPGKAERPMRFRDYVRRRSIRILPTFYASLLFVSLLGLAVPQLTGDPKMLPGSWGNALSHLVLLNAWFPKYITGWNSVTWSLSLEWTWYFTFPAALLLFRKVGAGRGFLILSGLCIAYRGALFLALGHTAGYHSDDVNYGFVWRTFIIGRLFEFGVGMYVAAWVGSGKQLPARLVDAGIVIVLALAVAGHLATPVDSFLPVRDMLYGATGAMLLLLICANRQNPMRWLLSHPVMVWIGAFSYTLYLFHLALLAVISLAFQKLGYTGLPLFALMLASAPFVILACWGIYLAVERPFVVSKPKQQPVPPPDARVVPAV